MAPTERREMVLEGSANKPVEKPPFSKRHPMIATFGKGVAAGVFLLGVSCTRPMDTISRPTTQAVPAAAAQAAPAETYDYARFRQIADNLATILQGHDISSPDIFDIPDFGEEVHGLYREIRAHFADIDAILARGGLMDVQVRFLTGMKAAVGSALSGETVQAAPIEAYNYAKIHEIAERINTLVPEAYSLSDPRIFDTNRFPETADEVSGLYAELQAHFADVDALIAGGTLAAEQVTFLNNLKRIVSSALAALRQQQIAASLPPIVCEVMPYSGSAGSGYIMVVCPEPAHIQELPTDLVFSLPAPPPAIQQSNPPYPSGRNTFGFSFGAQLNAPSIEPQDGLDMPYLHTVGVGIMFDISNLFLR